MPTLLVFLKAPVPGRVKSRLAADVGGQEATRVYIALARRVRRRLKLIKGIRVVWVYASANTFRDLKWLGITRAEIWPQVRGDLGRRLAAAFRRALQEGGPACAIGVDCPGLGVRRIREAFKALETDDLVLGPSDDGGYYLIGMNRQLPAVFQGIHWSTPSVFRETIAICGRMGLRVGRLPRDFDVDTLRDLRRWRQSLG